jgi:hypothetical protein
MFSLIDLISFIFLSPFFILFLNYFSNLEKYNINICNKLNYIIWEYNKNNN